MLASATACFAKTGSSPLRLAILHLADGSLSCRLGERGVVVEEREASSRRQGRKSGSQETRRWREPDSNPRSLSRRETRVRFAADSLVGWWRSARTVRRRLLWQELLRFHRRISL